MLFELKFCRQHDCTLDALGIFGNYREPIFIKITDDGLGSWVQAKAAGIDEQALRMLRAARDAYYQEYLRTEAIEIEGVVEALAELSRYARMAIVTTSKHMDFELIHEERQIRRFMDFVLVREDYELAKPHPELYLTGLRRFGDRKKKRWW